MTATEKVLAALQDRGCTPRRAGKGWSARCPSHEDRRASLSVFEGEGGKALVKCHAGCSHDAICAGIGLRVADLMPPSDAARGGGRAAGARELKAIGKAQIDTTYDYCDESGKLLFQAVRFVPKDFKQRRPVDGGRWIWSVKGVRVVPYRLPELLAAPKAMVAVVEGEKDVENLRGLGIVATCNAGGAGKWTTAHAEFLRGRHVVIFADNDDAGRRHAEQVARSLYSVAAAVRIVYLPGLPEKGDVSDWIAAGNTKEELLRLTNAAAVWTPTVEPWPDIEGFDDSDLPSFPTHVLPTVLRSWVETESHATQTPPDLPGLLALGVCSACIARRVEVEPRPGWREPVNLYVAVLLDPGNRKSAVFSDATKPLRELESELIEAARSTVARAQSERRQAEGRLRKLEKTAAEKGDTEARHEASNLAAELAEQMEPVLPRLLVDDATVEKLGMMLAEQGGRLASMSAEGGVFDLMAGLYSKSGIPQFGVYLMGHSGDDLITDRVSRKNVSVARPALTCAYAMQPAVIAGLAENAAFRGRGLLARYLYAAPKSWIGSREIAPAPVSQAIREAYHAAVRALASLCENSESASGSFLLRPSPQAAAMLQGWEAEIEQMLGDGGAMEIMCDWGAKLAGATLRLAAVLHCVEFGLAGRIEGQTMAAAIEIGQYLIPHAEAVLNLMQATDQSADDDAQYILRWINRHGRRDFTKRDAQQHGRRRFPQADDINPALEELTRRNYVRLRPAEPSGPGRPASPVYEVNPTVFAHSNSRERTRNTQNATSQTATGNSENTESAPYPTEGRAPDAEWGEL